MPDAHITRARHTRTSYVNIRTHARTHARENRKNGRMNGRMNGCTGADRYNDRYMVHPPVAEDWVNTIAPVPWSSDASVTVN